MLPVYHVQPAGLPGTRDNRCQISVRLGVSPERSIKPSWKVEDPEFSPLDLAIAPSGNVIVSSEHPFGTPDAATTVREYDRSDGHLVRVFAPDRGIGFRKPRGLRAGRQALLRRLGRNRRVRFRERHMLGRCCQAAGPQRPGCDLLWVNRKRMHASGGVQRFPHEQWPYEPKFKRVNG